ncbi:MAG: tRNA (adenosine(37)-N6)-threonylcarbamoyltransferase complex dimerization subunit type 1 TsaB [Candidatus Endonucleobacter bathymodioli]|uniref:tRNA threonylcarbamoyladenosine biosynthesis protein TsaB n=1 Tax=Candidatus Endonucleibacter bathymodioli TaxID=539814 RepID=A0AA90NTA4_9GAMM|nr:tRNA (adenosine(37)-N6)-threonylcarbamoyltransferase complex dimerization subunit type 1 TsaB [Candidatus Endonucleobacter bathymodioli]
MKLLAIDTATEACSVALNINGAVIEHYEVLPRSHSRELLPMVDKLLTEAGLVLTEIDGVAFGCGPGAFTGLRVAAAMVQGLAYAVDIPVIPVSTLASLAQQGYRCHGAQQAVSAIDARMNEVYWGAYIEQGQLMMSVQDEMVTAPEKVTTPAFVDDDNDWIGIGNGWRFMKRMTTNISHCYEQALPHAMDIALLAAAYFAQGRLLPAEDAVPIYLRNNVAKKKSER